MQVSITGRSVTATESIKDRIHKKIDRCLSMFPRIESVHVVLDVENRDFVVETVVQGADHIRVSATDKSENMYDAIDRAIEHTERQMRKLRDKHQDHYK